MTKQPTFYCSGFRPVTAEDPRAAAEIFAGREARREYGKNGYVRILRLDSWSADGSCTSYEAFIGYDSRDENATVGHNVWITVSR